MTRCPLIHLLCRGALAVAAFLALPAFSHAAEKPAPDLALVPADAPWFISIRPSDIFANPAMKPLKATREFAPAFAEMEKGLGVAPEGIERITFFSRRFLGNSPVVIVRTLKPYAREKVKKALRAGDEARAHGKTIFAQPTGWAPALWLADDRTFVFAQPGALVPYLAALSKPAKEHPLAGELKEAGGKHALTAAVLPRLFLRTLEADQRAWQKRQEEERAKILEGKRKDSERRFKEERKEGPGKVIEKGPKGDKPSRGFDLSMFKEEPLDLKKFEEAAEPSGRGGVPWFLFLSVMRGQRALVTVDMLARGRFKASGRLEFATEAQAREGEVGVEMGRIIVREALTFGTARKKMVPVDAAAVADSLRIAFRDATVKREAKVVSATLESDLVALFKAGGYWFTARPAAERPRGDTGPGKSAPEKEKGRHRPDGGKK